VDVLNIISKNIQDYKTCNVISIDLPQCNN